MKTTINLPFFVFEAIHTVNTVLGVIFRSNPENKTCLSRLFIPRKIVIKPVEPISEGGAEFASKISMWANGVYVDVVSEGYSDSVFGDQYSVVSISIKARRFGPNGGFARVGFVVDQILVGEVGMGGDEMRSLPEDVARQENTLRIIHAELA